MLSDSYRFSPKTFEMWYNKAYINCTSFIDKEL